MHIQRDYTIRIGDNWRAVDPQKADLAQIMDADHNGILDSSELERFVQNDRSEATHCNAPRSGVASRGDAPTLARELSFSMAGLANPDRAGYHSFSDLIQAFDELTAEHPGYVQKQVLGKSPEGRDIVAYKLSEGADGDTSHKTGIVITGLHHAREWMTVEAPLRLARDLLSNLDKDQAKQQRLRDGEIWIIPCTNPDGYEYSREHDNWWRKNRNPQTEDQVGQSSNAIGVDLNRNYADGNPDHAYIWRPEEDKPGVTHDDFDNTSDNPNSDVYRGPSGASEPETKALLGLELRPNIKGTVDYHSYGNDIFYPWDHTSEPHPQVEIYQEIGPKIAAATGWSWAQGSDLYLNAGDSTDNAGVNGILSFCFEMGRSFQPNPAQIPAITGAASRGTQVFIDEVLARSHSQG